jgi:RHS repeat-associated protein
MFGISTNTIIGSLGSLTTTWAQKSGAVTAISGATSMRIQLYNYLNNGWTAFDDVSVTGGEVGVTKYYYAGSTRVAMQRSGFATNNGVLYLFGDHLGSASRVANPDGTPYTGGEQRYKPWGEQRYPTDASTLPTTFQFTGQRIESGLSLYYYGARWYDSALGRFISPDSLIPDPYNSLDWDRYQYVRSNPIRWNDPSGHRPACEENCKEQQRLDKLYNKLGAINFMKQMIKEKYGIVMKDSDKMKWSNNNLITASIALYMIDKKLNGNLNTMVGGTTFTITDGGDQYYGWTASTGVTYHVASSSTQLPSINFLHETGHLLDNVPATEDVFSNQVPTTPTWVKDGYVDRGILRGKFNEPVQAIPMNEPNQPGEYWADAFANFVADNINLSKLSGQDMYDFVTAALAPYIGH